MQKLFRKFRRDKEGAVSVEFAFLVSFYVFLLMVSFVAFDALLMYNKASKANATVANLTSRVGSVDSDFNSDLFQIYKNVSYASDLEGWMRVSVIRNVNGTLKVRWSETNGTGEGVLTNTSDLLEDYIPNIIDGDEWVFLETKRNYTPLLASFGIAKTDFSHKVAFIPRFSGQLDHDSLIDFDDNYDGSVEPGDPNEGSGS